MAQVIHTGTIREAVGVFTDPAQLDKAVSELETTAFPRHDISILGHEDVLARLAADSPHANRTIPIRPEEKVIGASFIVGGGAYAGGVTAALVTGAAPLGVVGAMVLFGAIAGAGLGALIVRLFNMRIKRELRDRLDHGGMVLWVHTYDPAQENAACDIMRKYGARGVHVHETE